jgi:hypothetical protein
MRHIVRFMLLFTGAGGVIPPPPGDYSPSLDFSDGRNSMYSIGGF